MTHPKIAIIGGKSFSSSSLLLAFILDSKGHVPYLHCLGNERPESLEANLNLEVVLLVLPSHDSFSTTRSRAQSSTLM